MKALFSTSLLIVLISFSIRAIALEIVEPGETVERDQIIRQSPLDGLAHQGPGDDPVPWPWGSEMPFPWPFVQGYWMAEKGEFRSLYSFRIVRDDNNARQIFVEQIDPVSCAVVARGVAVETNNIVRAQMTAMNGQSYRLSVRSFSEKSIPSALISHRPIFGQYVVLSVYPFETLQGVHMPIQQISSQLNYKCLVEK